MWSVAEHAERGQSLAELTSTLEQMGLRCTDVLPLVVGDDGDVAMESAARLATLATATGASVCATAIGPEITDSAIVGSATDWVAAPRSSTAPASEWRSSTSHTRAWRASLTRWSCAKRSVGTPPGCSSTAGTRLVTGQVAALGGLSARDIAMVQFSDGVIPQLVDVREASRNHRRLPGRGEFDLAAFVDAVVATGYTGVVSP